MHYLCINTNDWAKPLTGANDQLCQWRLNTSPNALLTFSTARDCRAERTVLTVPQWDIILTLISGKAVSFDAQLNDHIVHSGYIYHSIAKSPFHLVLRKRQPRAVFRRKQSQFCKLLVIMLSFLLCKDRQRRPMKCCNWWRHTPTGGNCTGNS